MPRDRAASSTGLDVPYCEECGRFWRRPDLERWKAFLTAGEAPELAFYCSACAERDFGESY